MEQIPIRDYKHPWRITDDGMVEVDMEHKGFYHRIALDKYGTVVWKSMDGENTVADIVRIMEETFPDETDRMLDRVVTFTATLQHNGFITMSGTSQN